MVAGPSVGGTKSIDGMTETSELVCWTGGWRGLRRDRPGASGGDGLSDRDKTRQDKTRQTDRQTVKAGRRRHEEEEKSVGRCRGAECGVQNAECRMQNASWFGLC